MDSRGKIIRAFMLASLCAAFFSASPAMGCGFHAPLGKKKFTHIVEHLGIHIRQRGMIHDQAIFWKTVLPRQDRPELVYSCRGWRDLCREHVDVDGTC
jgi:hypothetical protein